jgi:hypothetical protein
MDESERIRCRVAACREPPAGAGEWRFYLINDGDVPLESAALYRVNTEWGDLGHSQAADVLVTDLAPGAQAPIWRDDGEFRIELSLLVRAGGREARLDFEFPSSTSRGTCGAWRPWASSGGRSPPKAEAV